MAFTTLTLAGLMLVPTLTPSDVDHVNSKDLEIPVRIDPSRQGEIKELILHYSSDLGQTWHQASPGLPPSQTAFTFHAPNDGQYWFQVSIVDKQGNRTNGIQRKVYVPIDEAHLDPGSFSTAPTVQPDDDAFGGTYSEMATGDVLTYPFSAADCLFELIGPGTGSWSVDVSIDGQLDETITPPGGGQRQILYSDNTCGSVYTFEVNTGAFGVDAVLG